MIVTDVNAFFGRRIREFEIDWSTVECSAWSRGVRLGCIALGCKYAFRCHKGSRFRGWPNSQFDGSMFLPVIFLPESLSSLLCSIVQPHQPPSSITQNMQAQLNLTAAYSGPLRKFHAWPPACNLNLFKIIIGVTRSPIKCRSIGDIQLNMQLKSIGALLRTGLDRGSGGRSLDDPDDILNSEEFRSTCIYKTLSLVVDVSFHATSRDIITIEKNFMPSQIVASIFWFTQD